MLELAALAGSGMLLGAGLSARRRGAPVSFARALYALSAGFFVIAILTFTPAP